MSATVPPPLAATLPAALTTGKQFVAYRLEQRRGASKLAKVPYAPDAPKGASSTDPRHWTTFDQAVKYSHVAGLDGVMRAFVETDGMVGVDLDNCRDPETGQLAVWAAEIVKRLDTYTEVSPSGAGLHLWSYATLPPHGRHKGDVELYSSARFFTLTGQHLEGTPTTIGYRPDAVAALHRDVFGATEVMETLAPMGASDPDRPVPALELGDDDVIRLAAESAHNGERFRRLWAGDTSDYAQGGNGGASEADAALCELLAFYGGPDRERIDRLFRASGLMREKWDERRLDSTYGRKTIDLALRGKSRFYGDSVRSPAPESDGTTSCTCPGCPNRDDRVHHLERRLLDTDDLVESQQAIIRAERTEKEQLADQIKGWKVVLSNPKLKPADRIAALPAIEHVLAARAVGQDEIHIRYPGIVAGWGLPESTLGTSIAILTERDGAPLAKRSQPGPEITVDTRRGPRTVTPSMVLIRAAVDGDLYAAVGTYDPELPQRGGYRAPPPPCPDHPAADYIARTVPQCGDCRRPLGPAREQWFTRRQNDALTDGVPPPVVVRTLRRQNDGLTDGEGTAEASRLSRPHFDGVTVLQPSWLDGWPDHAPAFRGYDDVLIAGGEA